MEDYNPLDPDQIINIQQSNDISITDVRSVNYIQPPGSTSDICFIDINPSSSNSHEHYSTTNINGLRSIDNADNDDISSLHSIESFVCRICHNNENLDKLVSPCLCKGSLTYVHIHCLERWISMSHCTTCELCQFQYNTQQTLRYTCCQSLRVWYSRSMSRRALQEDCQIFSLLTLVAFGIIGTLLTAVQYYILQNHISGLGRLWTNGWLMFFLFTTLVVYFINVYMIVRSQLTPWYRWWQSARDIRLILENRKPFTLCQIRNQKNENQTQSQSTSTTASATNMALSQATKTICQQQHQPLSEAGHHHQLQHGNDATCQSIPQTLVAIAANCTNSSSNNNNNTLMLVPLSNEASKKNHILEMEENIQSKLSATTSYTVELLQQPQKFLELIYP